MQPSLLCQILVCKSSIQNYTNKPPETDQISKLEAFVITMK